MTKRYNPKYGGRGVSRTTALIIVIIVIVLIIGGLAYYLYMTPAAEGELRIGIAGPLEYIQGIGHRRGAEMAAEEINNAGGITINGTKYKIKLFFEDTREADPTIPVEEGVSAVNRLITVNKVHAIIGGFRSDVVLAMQEEACKRRVPFIVAGASANSITEKVLENYEKYKYTFRITPVNSTTLAMTYIEFYKYLRMKYGFKNVYIIGEDALWTRLLAERVLVPFLPKLGYEIVGGPTYIPLGARDVSAEMADIINSKAELIAYIFSGDVGIVFTKYWYDVGVKALPVGINVYAQLDAYWEQTEGKCNYETNLIDVTGVESPIGEAFYKEYIKRYGDAPVYTAPATYIAVYLVAKAAEQAQSLNPDKLVKALEDIGGKGVWGHELAPLGPKQLYKFTKSHDIKWGVDDPSKGIIIAFQQWIDGKRYCVWPKAAATAEFKLPEWMKG